MFENRRLVFFGRVIGFFKFSLIYLVCIKYLFYVIIYNYSFGKKYKVRDDFKELVR